MTIAIVEHEKIAEYDVHQFIKTYGDEAEGIIESPTFAFAYVAIHETKIIGILLAWTSTYHSNCTYFQLILHPAYTHLTPEGELLATSKEHPSVKLPLQTLIDETSERLKDFYQTNGFIEIRRTYMPVLSIPNQKYVEIADEKHSVKSLDILIENDDLTEQLIRLAKLNYEQTHLHNPVADLPLSKWKELIFSDDLIMDASFVYIDKINQEVRAYSFLHTSENDEKAELGWCGSKDVADIQLISNLVHRQIEYAKKSEIMFIEGEFDTTSPYAMHVYKHTPFPNAPCWITYQTGE